MEIIQAIEDSGYVKPLLGPGRPAHWPSNIQWREWIQKYPDLAAEQDRAIAEYGMKLGYETIQIADGKDLLEGEQYDYMRARLRVNSRQWAAERLAKPVFGKTMDVNHGGQADNPIRSLIDAVSGTSFQPVPEDE
jgi:hypothetical protein